MPEHTIKRSTEPPDNLGSYRLEAEIGAGGMGTVYRAYDARLDRRVAIKRILAPMGERHLKTRRRFLREARLAARLSHPAIVQVHDLLRHEDEDWIVMELVDGSSFAELLLAGPLPIPRVIALGREIADGLAHAHRQGTIHRDLKPENLMVTAEGHAKILDFGLAKPVRDGEVQGSEEGLTVSGAILGTCRAMSPEQARGLDLDSRSDLFSFGTLLYEMATAVRPFEGQTPIDTLTRVCSHQPPSIDALIVDPPPPLTRLIDELLRKERARRPANAIEVAQELAAMAPTATCAADAPGQNGSVQTDTSLTLSTGLATIDSAATESMSPRTAAFGLSRRLRYVSWAAATATGVALAIAGSSALMESRDQTPARGDVVSVAADNSAPTESLYELTQRGQTLLETFYRPEDLDAAILAFERVVVRQPESAVAYAGLSRAFWRRYYAENRDPIWLEQAVSHGRRAVELDPFLSDGRVSLALAFIYLDRLDEAENSIEGALTLDPANADLYRAQAEILRFRGDLKEAERAMRHAIERRPDDFDLYDLLGSILARLGQLEDAAAMFLHSIELVPESLVAYRNLAGMYYRKGHIDEAAKWTQKALKVRPDSTLYASLGILYFDQGLYYEATQVLEKAVALPGGGHDFRVWGNLADAYRWTPDHDDQARLAYGQAIELLRAQGQNDAELRSRQALFLAKRGDLEEARRELETLAELESQEIATPYRIAVAWHLLDERARALEALAEALEAGYPLATVRRNPELTELRADIGFHRLIADQQDP